MKTPTVSVVIPCYDDAGVVSRATRSVINLPISAEAIIVDNTGDPSVADLDNCEGVYVISAPPQPAGHNRNIGLGACVGDYIQFLDADDRLLSDGMAPRIEALEKTGASVAVGRTKRVPKTGAPTVDELGESGGRPADQYLRGEFMPTIGGVICRREVFDRHRFDESMSRAQDFALWARVFYHEDVVVVDKPAFAYYQHDAQQSRKAVHERFAAVRRACLDIANEVPELRRAAMYRWGVAWVAEATKYRQEAGIPSISGTLADLAGGEPA